MKESHDEGLAIHIGPESCAGTGNGISEALTGESAGWVLSPEIKGNIPGADGLHMHGNSLHGNREALRLALEDRARVRTMNPKGERL